MVWWLNLDSVFGFDMGFDIAVVGIVAVPVQQHDYTLIHNPHIHTAPEHSHSQSK